MIRKICRCIICRESFPAEFAVLSSDELCICADCWENMDKFKTPSAFDELRMQCIAMQPYTGILRDAFLRYKFYGEMAYYTIFARLMRDGLLKMINKDDFDIIVPVPISKRRMNERGFNQTALFSKVVAEELGIEYSEIALLRKRNTKKQSTLSSRERFENVKDAFLAREDILKGKRVLLTDDIRTVGATMHECTRTIMAVGAKSVVGAVIFKSVSLDDET